MSDNERVTLAVERATNFLYEEQIERLDETRQVLREWLEIHLSEVPTNGNPPFGFDLDTAEIAQALANVSQVRHDLGDLANRIADLRTMLDGEDAEGLIGEDGKWLRPKQEVNA